MSTTHSMQLPLYEIDLRDWSIRSSYLRLLSERTLLRKSTCKLGHTSEQHSFGRSLYIHLPNDIKWIMEYVVP
jgi:hypothetical protein